MTLEAMPIAAPGPAAGALSALLFESHGPQLRRHALRVCRDPDTADDLVQEAFVRLFVEIEAGRTPQNVAAWLHRVVGNLAVSLARRAVVRRRFADALVDRGTPEEPEAIVLEAELRGSLAAVLDELSEEARTALLLAASGFSGAEIAAAIGRTHGATRSLMCRTRLQLRARLEAADRVS